jgi:hypothetical protein
MADPAFRLIVRKGPNPGVVFDLMKEVSLVGRDVSNDIVIGDAEVSRQHARLTRTPGGFVLEDLGSTNGTFVNSERLMAPRVLNPGDLVGFGENITLTFESTAPEAAATVASPAAEPGRQAPAPPPQAPAPPPQAAAAPPSPVAPPARKEPALVAEPERSRTGWVIGGLGCIGLVIVCIVVFAVMDAFFPDIIYAPFNLFGF